MPVATLQQHVLVCWLFDDLLAALHCYRLAAQLARTEEAAKRALIRADQGAKGSTAQQLLDAQRQIQQLQAENSELSTKLAR